MAARNDCDGEIDDSAIDTQTWYEDADADGYGNPANTTEACSVPDGYTSDATDCDDSSASIYPGATEIAGDGIDQDCDGSDPEMPDYTGSEPGWFHANYGSPSEHFVPGADYSTGSLNCGTVCSHFGLSPRGARFVCNRHSGVGPTEGCHDGNEGFYGEENCGWMMRDFVELTENGNTEDCAGGAIDTCVSGSCYEGVTWHSLECQCG